MALDVDDTLMLMTMAVMMSISREWIVSTEILSNSLGERERYEEPDILVSGAIPRVRKMLDGPRTPNIHLIR